MNVYDCSKQKYHDVSNIKCLVLENYCSVEEYQFRGKITTPLQMVKKQSFLLDAQRAGFEPEATFEQILQAFRSRCRANIEGVFDGYDCALMKKFADIFDVDELSNPQ